MKFIDLRKTLENIHESKKSNKNIAPTHLLHLEDLPIYYPSSQVAKYLKSFPRSSVSIKMDGSPSFFAGIDPKDNRFFVSTKSILNKNPIIFKNKKEISKSDLSEDLKLKLLQVFSHLYRLNIKGIIQGDYLYGKESLKKKFINGIQHFVFHSNILVYACPVNSRLGRLIEKSNIGVAIHTCWKGTIGNLVRSSKAPEFNRHTSVWTPQLSIDPKIVMNDMTLQAVKDTLRILSGHQDLIDSLYKKGSSKALEKYHNMLIKKGQSAQNKESYNKGLMDFLSTSEKPHKCTIEELNALYDVRQSLLEIKSYLKADTQKGLSNISVYIIKDKDLKKFNHEGLVVKPIGLRPFKVVSRESFSKVNFRDDKADRAWKKDERIQSPNRKTRQQYRKRELSSP